MDTRLIDAAIEDMLSTRIHLCDANGCSAAHGWRMYQAHVGKYDPELFMPRGSSGYVQSRFSVLRVAYFCARGMTPHDATRILDLCARRPVPRAGNGMDVAAALILARHTATEHGMVVPFGYLLDLYVDATGDASVYDHRPARRKLWGSFTRMHRFGVANDNELKHVKFIS